jgi:hypothetical protein
VKNTTSQLTPSGFSKSAESLVGGYELLWQSPNEDPDLNQTIDAADIRYVGVASDIADGWFNSYAALSTWKEWSTPAELLAGVTLDVDQDGLPDWIYITAPIDETDVYQILLIDINDFSGAGSGASFEWDVINGIDADTDTRVLKSDVMTIPFQTHPAFWGSLTTSGADSSHAFDFSVFAFHFDDDVNFDESPILTFDPEQPGLAFEAPGRLPEAFGGVTPFSRSVSGGTLPFRINVSGPGDAAKALLVHNFNAAGRRAEIVSIDTEVASDQLLTNGDLEGGGSPVPTGWVGTGLKPGDSLVSNNPAQGTFAFQFSGKATSARTLSQTVPFSPGEGDAGDVLRFDAQVSAGGMQTGDSAKLTLEITYTDGKKQVVVTPLNDQMEYGVPRSAGLVIAAKPYKQVKVTVSATLKNDASSLFVDEFSLSRPQY